MQLDRTTHRRAVTRNRVTRWRKDQRVNRLNPTVAYDAAMLGMLVLQGYITDDDTHDQAKVNAALTQKLRDDTRNVTSVPSLRVYSWGMSTRPNPIRPVYPSRTAAAPIFRAASALLLCRATCGSRRYWPGGHRRI